MALSAVLTALAVLAAFRAALTVVEPKDSPVGTKTFAVHNILWSSAIAVAAYFGPVPFGAYALITALFLPVLLLWYGTRKRNSAS